MADQASDCWAKTLKVFCELAMHSLRFAGNDVFFLIRFVHTHLYGVHEDNDDDGLPNCLSCWLRGRTYYTYLYTAAAAARANYAIIRAARGSSDSQNSPQLLVCRIFAVLSVARAQ